MTVRFPIRRVQTHLETGKSNQITSGKEKWLGSEKPLGSHGWVERFARRHAGARTRVPRSTRRRRSGRIGARKRSRPDTPREAPRKLGKRNRGTMRDGHRLRRASKPRSPTWRPRKRTTPFHRAASGTNGRMTTATSRRRTRKGHTHDGRHRREGRLRLGASKKGETNKKYTTHTRFGRVRTDREVG